MLEKRWLRPVDGRGKLIEVVEYHSRDAPETLSAKI